MRIVTRVLAHSHQFWQSRATRLRRAQAAIAPKPPRTTPHSNNLSVKPGARPVSTAANAPIMKATSVQSLPHFGPGVGRELWEPALTSHIEAPDPP
jgi:hypothetical protein